MRGNQATTRGRRTAGRTRRTRGARRATSRSRRTTRTSCSACGAMRTARQGEIILKFTFAKPAHSGIIIIIIPGPITVTTGSGIMCRNMQKRTIKIFSRYLWWTKPAFHFLYPRTPLSQGYQGAKETEKGKVSRLRDEAIKAVEEKKREEEEREKKPGKDGIRVRLKIFIIFLYSS